MPVIIDELWKILDGSGANLPFNFGTFSGLFELREKALMFC